MCVCLNKGIVYCLDLKKIVDAIPKLAFSFQPDLNFNMRDIVSKIAALADSQVLLVLYLPKHLENNSNHKFPIFFV